MKKTNEKMEKLRSQLNKLIEKNVSYDKILKKSQQLDKCFMKYYQEQERFSK